MTLTSCGACNWRRAVGGPKLRHVVVVEVLLFGHRNRRLIRDGSQDGHLDFHTVPELC